MSTLKLLTALILVWAFPQANTGLIRGKITHLDGSGAVSGVQVLLVGPATGTALNALTSNPLMAAEIAEGASLNQVTITTEEDGGFSFRNLAPGQYTIRARREGYFGSSSTGSPPTSPFALLSVNLAAGQTTLEVSLAMAQGSAISGRITDPRGQAMPNVDVSIFKMSYSEGRPSLTISQSKTTDDSGEYRFYWLPPGEYYVGVTPPRPSVTDGRPQAYARTFYPSTTDAHSAERFNLKDGADLKGINITAAAINSVRVSGQVVTSMSGATTQSAPFSTFILMSRDSTTLTDSFMQFFNERLPRSAQFELRGVPSGSYDLITTAADNQGRSFPGRARIEVGSQDVDNVTLTVLPGVEVRARVIFDGQPIAGLLQANPTGLRGGAINSGPNGPTTRAIQISSTPSLVDRGTGPPAIRLQLHSRESYPSVFDSAAALNTTIDASGTITFPSVPESVYAVQVSGTVPANTYVADIREGSVSIYESGITVGSQATGMIDVILKSGGSTFTGSVRDAENKALVNAVVVMVPQQPLRRNPALYKNVRTGLDGSFTITAVPPGEYKLFAWTDVFSVPDTAYMNPEFISKYESRGKDVTAGLGVNSNVTLNPLPSN